MQREVKHLLALCESSGARINNGVRPVIQSRRLCSTTANFRTPAVQKQMKDAQRTPWPKAQRSSLFESESSSVRDSGLQNKESAKEAFQKLIKDLEELKGLNPSMSLQANNSDMSAMVKFLNRPDISHFKVVVQDDSHLGFECPSTPGVLRTYGKDEFGSWNCVSDGHNLHGLFLRDLIPLISGLPRWALK